MRHLLCALFFIAIPTGALHAQTMPVATFLAKADALKKKGPLAFFSSDYHKLKAEVDNSARALGAEQLAAQKAGRKPATCMPKKVSIGTDELLNHFRAIPQAQRGASVKAAFASFANKKYPCPS
ncbi:MAG TPA: hypothetical protein VEZ70_14340 [Allosphingosinicella sp.]|nr:hypothetical protein [Allosphingosinicella sp.]